MIFRWMKYGLAALGFVAIIAVGFGLWYAESMREQAKAQRAEKLEAAKLDPAKQKQIWDAEHVTFEIETRFGTAMVAAIKSADQPRVASFFRKELTATLLAPGGETVRKSGRVTERKKTTGDSPGRAADAGQVVASLLEPASHFQKIEHARLRVLAIDHVGDGHEWNTRLLITLVGVGKTSERLLFESKHNVQLRIGDEKELGRKPVIAKWDTQSETFREAPRFLLEEVTDKVGLDRLSLLDNWKLKRDSVRMDHNFQMAVADFDRDGVLDIALAPHEGSPMLLKRGPDGRYVDVASKMGIATTGLGEPYHFAAAWIDFNNDGYPDLIMRHRLYRNDSGKRFIDVTEKSGLDLQHSCMGCVVADYDCDGRLDVYALYAPSQEPMEEAQPWVGGDTSGRENQLWRNEGNGRFRDVTKESGSGGGTRETFAAAWFFYDDDHFPDLYLANDFGDNLVLRNQGDGTFRDVSGQSKAAAFATSMGVVTGDVNNDGKTDIYVANMFSKMGERIIRNVSAKDYPEGIYRRIQGSCAGNLLFLADPSNGFRETSKPMGVNAVGWAYAPAMVDLDGDGWLDLYATTGYLSFDRGKPDG